MDSSAEIAAIGNSASLNVSLHKPKDDHLLLVSPGYTIQSIDTHDVPLDEYENNDSDSDDDWVNVSEVD